jgi:hypothetical protein
MKYMMLMQFSSLTADFPEISTWTPDEIRAHIAFMGDVNAAMQEAGEFVDAKGLAGAETAKIVRAGDGGTPIVTEGPFAESKEFLAGWWIMDVETPERAVELAAHVSTAPGPGGKPLNMAIEIRQILSEPPTEF